MEFWIFVKKFFAGWVNPVGLPLFLLVVGFALIFSVSRSPRRQLSERWLRLRAFCGDCGLFLSFLGIIILFLGSFSPVTSRLVESLEEIYPPIEERDGHPIIVEKPQFIVVLAGGQRNSPGRPVLSRLALVPLARVVGGVDLWKSFPESALVFTGTPAETTAMRGVAEKLGVPHERIIEETESRCTADHPVKLKPILGYAPFLLVTSAVHMPRSVGLFQHVGLNFIPAPVDFAVWTASKKEQSNSLVGYSPKSTNLRLTDAALHEYGGLIWSWMCGELAPLPK